MIENKKSTKVGSNINVKEACANVDYKYGVYNSKEEAIEALGENGMDVIALGLTVGIMTEGGVEEYWWKSGTRPEDLVHKDDDDEWEEL